MAKVVVSPVHRNFGRSGQLRVSHEVVGGIQSQDRRGRQFGVTLEVIGGGQTKDCWHTEFTG